MTIRTNDPQHPELKLTIRGRVEPYVSISPRQFDLDGIAGKRISRQITILPHRDHPFSITASSIASGQNVTFELRPTDASQPYGYLLSIDAIRQQPGFLQDTITLSTDSAKVGDIKISITGFLKPGDDHSKAYN